MPNIVMIVNGLQELINKNNRRMDSNLHARAMHDAMIEGRRRAKELCPVDTGYMRSQIEAVRKGIHTWSLSCKCAYASFNEFGWYGIPEVGTAELPVHYRGGYRPFLRVGMLHATKQYKKYIKYVIVHGRFYTK